MAELTVVIFVIGILTALVVVSYGDFKTSTISAQLKSNLLDAGMVMESARNFGNSYPASVPSTFTASNGVTISGGSYDGGKTYCLDAINSSTPSIHFYIDSVNSSLPLTGTCADVHPAPANFTAVATSSSSISLAWNTVPGTVNYVLQRDTSSSFNTPTTVTQTGTTYTSSGLTQSTTYYYRVNAINAVSASVWAITTATTTSALPAIESLTATSITDDSATMGANITSNGGYAISARGICWGLSAAPTSNCVAEGGTSTGIFTMSVINIVGGTHIYYRAYATNSYGTGYSADGTIDLFRLVDVLAVGGGGAGGKDSTYSGANNGGGGAGGYQYIQNFSMSSPQSYAVTVGAGGTVSTRNGQNSTFSTITAIGGGAGGDSSNGYAGQNGGSGGGGVQLYAARSIGSQGNSGGYRAYEGGCSGSMDTSGGGGGAGGVGGNMQPCSWTSASGGPGLSNSISGVATYYAGGGGAGNDSSTHADAYGMGGIGGGGNGARRDHNDDITGIANTGGGGGGGGFYTFYWTCPGGDGGSGIVIIRYRTGMFTATGGTITYTDINGLNPRTSPAYAGGYTVHTFTSSGNLVVN